MPANNNQRYCKLCGKRVRAKYLANYRRLDRHRKTQRQKECRKTLSGYVFHLIGGIKARCTNPREKSYPRYGGRNIKLCFNAGELLDWLKKYGVDPRGLETHRIDNDRDYSLDNIEFLTKNEHLEKHKFRKK